MDIGYLVNTIVQFFSDQTIFAVAVLAVVAFLVYRKPKEMAKLGVIILVVGLLYGIGNLLWDSTFSGVSNKRDMVEDKMEE